MVHDQFVEIGKILDPKIKNINLKSYKFLNINKLNILIIIPLLLYNALQKVHHMQCLQNQFHDESTQWEKALNTVLIVI